MFSLLLMKKKLSRQPSAQGHQWHDKKPHSLIPTKLTGDECPAADATFSGGDHHLTWSLRFITLLPPGQSGENLMTSRFLDVFLAAILRTYQPIYYFTNRPFSKMAAENLNKSKLKTNTSTRKSTLTLVTLPSFSISGEISAEKM